MTGLLMKDLRLLKHQGRYYLSTIALACVIMFASTRDFSSFVTSYLTFMIAMFSFNSFSYDEYDNGLPFLMALPCGLRVYVAEKYVFTVLLVSTGWAVGVVIQTVGSMARFSTEEYLIILSEAPIYLLIVLIYMGFSIPILVKFGAEKGRNAMLIGMGIIAAVIFGIAKTNLKIPLAGALDSMSETPPVWIVLFLLLLCILVMGISYKISVYLIEKKEF